MANPTFQDGALPRRKRPGAVLLPEDSSLLVESLGIHHATPPNLIEGDVCPTQMDDLGNIKISFGDPAQLAGLGGGAPSTIGNGSKNVTTSGTAVALASSTECLHVIIVAKEANTGVIWVGGASVAVGSGRPLLPLQSEKIEIDNLSKVYIDASVNGEGVTFVYVA